MGKKIVFRGARDMPPLAVSLASTLHNKTGTWKYIRPLYKDKLAPCVESCPAGEDIQGYMYLVKQANFDEAIELILKENPFPSVCGRVCYHPCESACNRGQFDEPLAINATERVIGDHGLEFDIERLRYGDDQKEKVAVIGSGPAGLTCAYHLARMGYKVTVFEAYSQSGGMLRVGIPEYRLPKDILDQEIKRIEKLGVQIRCNSPVGKEISWKDLAEFGAVFIATGVHKSRKMRIPGEDAPGVITGLEFLGRLNSGQKVNVGKKVGVIGGGNTAMDAARSALRLGAKPVVLYRRTRAEMPAIEDEIEEALKEGIEIAFLTAPVRVLSQDGKVSALECVKMELGEPDESGRRRPIPIPHSNYTIEIDTVIMAIGEEADVSFVPEGLRVENGAIRVDEVAATSVEGFFAGGDVIDQPHTVVHAIGSGKKAAMAIDTYFKGENLRQLWEQIKLGHKESLSMRRYLGDVPADDPDNLQVVHFEQLNLDYFEKQNRRAVLEVPVEKRIKDFREAKHSLTKEEAITEAQRCFNCGVCNECDNCLLYCPDLAITRRTSGYRYWINLDYCKGCGICAHECPRSSIYMITEGR